MNARKWWQMVWEEAPSTTWVLCPFVMVTLTTKCSKEGLKLSITFHPVPRPVCNLLSPQKVKRQRSVNLFAEWARRGILVFQWKELWYMSYVKQTGTGTWTWTSNHLLSIVTVPHILLCVLLYWSNTNNWLDLLVYFYIGSYINYSKVWLYMHFCM